MAKAAAGKAAKAQAAGARGKAKGEDVEDEVEDEDEGVRNGRKRGRRVQVGRGRGAVPLVRCPPCGVSLTLPYGGGRV